MPTAWTPILEGALAERATTAAKQIADAVAPLDDPADELAVFWSYAAPAFADELTAARHDAAMDALARRILRGSANPALYGGAAGLGWVVAHTSEGSDELLERIDLALRDMLRADTWTGDYDLIGGLVGYGVYFLERGDAASAKTGLALVIDQLARTSVRTADQITWHTAPELLPPDQRQSTPNGYHNCGMAHGVPSVVALLSRVIARGDSPPGAVELRDGAARWVMAQRLADGPTLFPATVIEHVGSPARTAWCYGDPGVLAALWRATPTPEIAALALDCLSRPLSATGVVDAPLCHGAAGLAHLCNRFYQATGEPRFRALAHTWFEHTLAYQVPDHGVGGFRSYVPAAGDAAAQWRDSPRFLDGAIGIGLALLAATTAIEPRWDRLMLCDLPILGSA